jgi:hypothetical protein
VVDGKGIVIFWMPIFGNENFRKLFVFDEVVNKWEN